MRSRYIPGGGVECYINGSLYANVMGIHFSSQTPKKRIFGVDQVYPYELAPTHTVCTGSMQLYRLSMTSGTTGVMTSHYYDLPKEKYFSIDLVDKKSGMVFFHTTTATAIAENWDIRTKQVMMGALQFECIIWTNELQPKASRSDDPFNEG
jgi:hypothetical protein